MKKNMQAKRWLQALALVGTVVLAGCGKKVDTAATNGLINGGYGISGGCAGAGAGAVIPFAGNNIYADSAGFKGGQLPYGQAFGTMGIGGGATGPFNGDGVYYSMQMQAQAIGPNLANVSGQIALKQPAIDEFNFGCSPYNPQGFAGYCQAAGQTNHCVSGISMDAGYLQSGRMFGTMYFFLNNTNHGKGLMM